MRNQPKKSKPIFDSLPEAEASFIRGIVLEFAVKRARLATVTHPINFRRPSHVIRWLEGSKIIMQWSSIRTGKWLHPEQLRKDGHLSVLFSALEEWGLHLTGKQKKKLVNEYEQRGWEEKNKF